MRYALRPFSVLVAAILLVSGATLVTHAQVGKSLGVVDVNESVCVTIGGIS